MIRHMTTDDQKDEILHSEWKSISKFPRCILTRVSKTEVSGPLRQEEYCGHYPREPKVGDYFTLICTDFVPNRLIETSFIIETSEQVFNSDGFRAPFTFKTFSGSVYEFRPIKALTDCDENPKSEI